MLNKLNYTLNVGAILQNNSSDILVGERADVAGAWQFPQGSLETGESYEQALERELAEELSLVRGDYAIVGHKGPYRYDYSDEVMKKKCSRGKEQRYFLLRLIAPESRIDVCTARPEFRAVRWIKPEDFELEWLPQMKRQVYRSVFKDFFNVEK
jgi:putative (di)nucleoside polyphosphate hydrolase